jgi:hypothetical protein
MEAVMNDYNSFMESCDNEINDMFAEFNIIHEKVMLESEIMDTVPEDMMMVYEAGKKNLFTKIGEKVIELFKKIKELIDKGIENLKELSFKNKTTMQKAEIFAKKHPEFKNEIIDSIKSGALDLNDMRSLKELEVAYDEIIRLSKKKGVDPKTLRGKWEKAKEKFNNDTVMKTADTVGKVVTVGGALAFFIPNILKAVNELSDQKKKIKDREAETLSNLNSYKLDDGSSAIDNIRGINELKLQMIREQHGAISKVIGNTTSIFSKLATAIARGVDKITDKDGSRADEYITNVTYHNTKNVNDVIKKRNEEIDLEAKKAEARKAQTTK